MDGELASDGTYQNVDVSALVQRWAEGASTHYGFTLGKTTAAAGGAPVVVAAPTSGDAPSLYLDWGPRAGDRKSNAAIKVDLTDRTSVTVNPASGNAAVTTEELTIAGQGLDLNVAHTSNSLSPGALGVLGLGWTSTLTGPRLVPYTAGTMLFFDASGAQWVFYRAQDGSWTRPDGLDADLVANTGGTFTMTQRGSKVAQTFVNTGTSASPDYHLSTVVDRNGNQITLTYDTSARTPWDDTLILRSVTDTRGRVLEVTNWGYYDAYRVDSANRVTNYDVSPSNELASFTDTGGGITRYEYDTEHRVTAITAPEGQRAPSSPTTPRGGSPSSPS